MYTKTGLRPRESRRNGDSISIQKLPPIVATTTAASRDPHSNGSGGGGGGGGGSVKVTARMLRARREGAKTRLAATAATATAAATVEKSEDRLAPPPSAGGRGRQELRLPTLPGKGRAGRVLARPKRGTSRGRDKTSGGGRGGKGADSGARPVRKRPEWDGNVRDLSQFRLTPEEAMTRKISLVSKHNTFAFGLGSDSRGGGDGYAGGLAGFSATTTTSKEAICPLSAEAARVRSAKRVGERSRKVAGGEQRNHRRSRSEGGVSAPRGGKDAVSPPAPSGSGGDDLTVSGNGEGDHETGGPNDLTMALYAVRDNNTSSRLIEGCGGPPAKTATGRAGRSRFGYGDSGANRSGNEGCGGSGGGGGAGGGGDVAASGLAGIEFGIKAFSRRVSRLETCRRGRIGAGGGLEGVEREREAVKLKMEEEEEVEKDEEEGEKALTDWRETRTSGVGVTSEEADGHSRLSGAGLREAAHPEDVEAGELRQTPVRTTAAAADGYSTESRRKMHGSEHAWGDGEPSTTQPRRDGGKFRGHSHGSTEAVDLVERVQNLEEQVRQACLAPPHALDGSASSAPSAENMQVVIADLLSLTALLLGRATVAEGCLAELSRGRGAPAPDDSEYDSEPHDASAAKGKDVHDRALLVRARAEASILAGDADRPPEERDDDAGTPGAAAGASPTDDDLSGVSGGGDGGGGGGSGGGDGGDTCPSPRECTHSGSSFVEPPTDYLRAGRSLARVGPSPRFHEKRAAAPCAAAKDCWGEALDTVGHLVKEIRHADCDEVELKLEVTPTKRTVLSAASMRPPPSSSLRGSPLPLSSSAYPTLPPLPAPVTATAATADTGVIAAAAAAADLSPIHKTGPETPYSLGGQLPPPPPPPPPLPVACVAGGVARRCEARDALAPLHFPGLSLAEDMNSCCGPDFDFSAISTFEEHDGEEEEDARSLPVCLAPTPTKKPEHPFQQAAPVRPLPVLRPHVGQEAGVSSNYAPALTVGGGGGSLRQHVGQEGGVSREYAPAFTVGGRGGGGDGRSSSSRERVHGGGGGLDPPAIGQWYTPASAGEGR